jgi:hypothetical protein
VNALLVMTMLVAAEPEAVATAPAQPEFRLNVGGQVGFPFLLGVKTEGTFFKEGRPRFDIDAAWEPSVSLQSYSLGAAYHVLDRAFFVGGRLRMLQYQAPWARGPVEMFFGMGLELGLKLRVGPDEKGVITIALHGTFVPGQATNLNTVLGLSAGFSWSVFERAASK